MPKALMLSVYSNKIFRGCANGGITETEDTIYVEHPKGPFDVDDTDPRLFRIANTYDSIHLEPVNRPNNDKTIGPMMGGSYAASSDARFISLCEDTLGYPFYGAVAVHDRFETPAQYEALSR